MKKMLFGLITCALISTSCSMNEVMENTANSNAIRFSNVNSCFTKAANDVSSDYRVFSVWSASSTAWYMNNQVRGLNNAYIPQKYWPGVGTVSFFAYAPDASANFAVTNTPVSAVGGVYTVSADAQEDFTIATPISGQNSGLVELMFNHMLSKITMTIGFPITGELDGYEIVSSTAKFILDYNAASFDVMSATPMQNYNGTVGTYEYSINPNGHNLLNANFLNILPQPANNSGKLELTITIKDKATGENFIVDKKLATIKLKDIAALTNNGKLDSGKWYQFSVTISSTSTDGNGDKLFNDIVVRSNTSDWTPGISVPTPQP